MAKRPTSTPPSQIAVLGPHLELIRELRARGRSVQQIALQLKRHGVEVNRVAVHRFCQKHGIPLGNPQAEPKPPPAVLHNYVAFAPVEAKVGQIEPKPIEPSAPHPARRARATPAPAEPPPAPQAPAPQLVEPPAPAWPADVTAEQLAAAKILLDGAPHREAIDAAWKAQDPERLEKALQASKDWLESIRDKVPASFHEAIQSALMETQPWLEAAEAAAAAAPLKVEASAPPAPLFTPLPRAPVWTPDLELVSFNDQDVWTLQDACEGTLILGATGSGKTSGSGQTIARSFMAAHFGGLVLTAKESEPGLWERYARETGRTEQLCRVHAGGPFRFNFLDYQARLPDDQGGSTENVVELLQTILDAFSRGSGRRSGDDGSFWVNTSRQLFRNAVRILKATSTPLTFGTLRSFMTEAPQSLEEAKSQSWRMMPTFGTLIAKVEHLQKSGTAPPDVMESLRYWLTDFPSLNPKTRSIVVTDVSSMVDLFFDPTLGALLCSDTTITPEAVFDGAVIVIDLPIEKWLSIGRMAQVVWKYFLQLVVRRRTDADDASRRPVFLWADEFQHFLAGESDAAFQATARSSRCATVYLTQTIPGLSIQAGSPLPKERVDALTANLSTKIFHANADPTTNLWAAEQVGKSMQYRASVTTGDEHSAPSRGWGLLDLLTGGHSRSKVSTSPVVDFDLQPGEFAKLRTGSKRFKGQVDAVVLKSGKRFSTGSHWLKTTFQQ